MKTLNYECEKEIAQDILKLLDGLPYNTVKRIIERISKDASENSYLELKPLQTYQIGLDSGKLKKFGDKLEEIGQKYFGENWNDADDDETIDETSD